MGRIEEIRERVENGQPSCRSDTMFLLSELAIRDRAFEIALTDALSVIRSAGVPCIPLLTTIAESALERARAELAKPEGAKEE